MPVDLRSTDHVGGGPGGAGSRFALRLAGCRWSGGACGGSTHRVARSWTNVTFVRPGWTNGALVCRVGQEPLSSRGGGPRSASGGPPAGLRRRLRGGRPQLQQGPPLPSRRPTQVGTTATDPASLAKPGALARCGGGCGPRARRAGRRDGRGAWGGGGEPPAGGAGPGGGVGG